MKKYQIIYADPPWEYRDKAAAGKRGSSFKYPTQSTNWIATLPIHKITDVNCALFLWCTMPNLPEAFKVMEGWGFTYKTSAFTWVKRNKKTPSWFWGMGNWTRANAELCLLGIKGKPKRISAGVHSIIESPIERHSQKPAIVRDKIVELLGDLPRIELFSREAPEGWDTWGNECENSIDLMKIQMEEDNIKLRKLYEELKEKSENATI